MSHVVILGAGLTGLSTAYHFEKNNFFDFTIFEKENSPGGLARSVVDQGFTFDYTGHLLHSNNAYFSQFINELFPPNSLNKLTRNAQVYSHNSFLPYPFQMNLLGLPAPVILECLCGFAKRKHTIKTPENFHQWVLKYFGTGMGKHFFFPYNTKLLCHDLKKICPSWTNNFVPKTNLSDIFNGLSAQKNDLVGYNHTFLYPKYGGIQSLVNALHNKITTPIKINHTAIKIDLASKQVVFSNGHVERFSTLITTLPLKELLGILKEQSSTNLAQARHHLQCNSVLNINLGIARPHVTNMHWVYVPEKNIPFYRLGCWNNFSSQLAPHGTSSLYTEIAYMSQAEKNIDHHKIATQTQTHVCSMMNISAHEIVVQKNLPLPYAYVIYDQWREQNLSALHRALNNQSIYSIGRYGGWNYSSMQDAILYGKQIASNICPQYQPAKAPHQTFSAIPTSQKKSDPMREQTP